MELFKDRMKHPIFFGFIISFIYWNYPALVYFAKLTSQDDLKTYVIGYDYSFWKPIFSGLTAPILIAVGELWLKFAAMIADLIRDFESFKQYYNIKKEDLHELVGAELVEDYGKYTSNRVSLAQEYSDNIVAKINNANSGGPNIIINSSDARSIRNHVESLNAQLKMISERAEAIKIGSLTRNL